MNPYINPSENTSNPSDGTTGDGTTGDGTTGDGTGDDFRGDDVIGDEERPMTEFLLDQFAGWHLICVLAVKALNEARRQNSAGNPDVGA